MRLGTPHEVSGAIVKRLPNYRPKELEWGPPSLGRGISSVCAFFHACGEASGAGRMRGSPKGLLRQVVRTIGQWL